MVRIGMILLTVLLLQACPAEQRTQYAKPYFEWPSTEFDKSSPFHHPEKGHTSDCDVLDNTTCWHWL